MGHQTHGNWRRCPTLQVKATVRRTATAGSEAEDDNDLPAGPFPGSKVWVQVGEADLLLQGQRGRGGRRRPSAESQPAFGGVENIEPEEFRFAKSPARAVAGPRARSRNS